MLLSRLKFSLQANTPKALTVLVALLMAIYFFYQGLSRPELNWDIIGYVASAHYHDGVRGDELKEKTFSEIKKATSPELYDKLINENTYRATVFKNANSLNEQVPFYAGRVAYLGAVKAISTIGSLSYAESTYVVSAIFTGLTISVLYCFFLPNALWVLLISPYIFSVAGFTELAKFSTPDAMAAFFAITGLLLALKRNPWALVPLTILPTIRTDFIILPFLATAYLFWVDRKARALLLCVLPLIAYILVNKLNPGYGYLKVFYFTLIENNPFPATMEISRDIKLYLEAYWKGFGVMLGHKHFIIFAVYIFVWYKYLKNKIPLKQHGQGLIIISFVMAHMLLFPAYYQRFFAWAAAIAGLQTLQWLNGYFQNSKNPVSNG